MKNIKRSIVILTVVAALVTGCSKSALEKLNVDPQAQGDINLNFLFSAVQLGLTSGGTLGENRDLDWRVNIGYGAYAIQHLAFLDQGIAPGDKYEEYAEGDERPFRYFYTDGLRKMSDILYQVDSGFAVGQNYNNLKQATRIMKAFSFQRLTDLYGSIPYFEALQPRSGIFSPKYDKQKDIYMALLAELDEATAAFTAADPTDGLAAADLFYAGDIDKWKRFGYSLMLRMAMRISNVDAATANTYVAKAIAGGVFQSNNDNVYVQMAVGPNPYLNQNGMSRTFIPGDGGQSSNLSRTLINFLKGGDTAITADDDPRLMIISGGIAQWPDESTWIPSNVTPLGQKGMPNGCDDRMLREYEGLSPTDPFDKYDYYSRMNPRLLDRDDPYMLMNYGEVEFNLAEAAERSIGGLTPGDAKAHYEAGVRASMQMYDIYDAAFAVTDAQVNTYLAAHLYGVFKPALEMIGEQIWVNHF
ncbi:MAG: SusD/RagB family nutrient-binding outer membrane lipoprotein, partial [Flavihumibacter sp.]